MTIDDVKNKIIKIKYDIAKGEIVRHRNFEHEEHLMQEEYEAVGVAIMSLIAWEKVRQEIIKQSAKVPTLQNEYLNGLKTAYAHTLAIIDEHLQKVKK